MLYSELTRNITGAAIQVHKILGAGFAESVYEEPFAIEFDLQKIPYERQKSFDIFYKGRFTIQFICDFVVYDRIIVELKAIKIFTDIETAQVLNCLKVTGLNLGLLLNFGSSSLEYKRLINTSL